ncbi:MAG: ABC transporter ATP-binding protein [Bacillota bacterium]
MIEAKDLVKSYGNTEVLNIPYIKINSGESFGLVGNNGAGKTTFFSLMLDLIEAAKGQVLSDGITVAGSDHWKSYTGAFLDEKYLIEFLYPEEYFKFICDINNITKSSFQQIIAPFNDFFNGAILDQKKFIRDLSKGNQKKVGIAAAMLTKPKVLILDEPFTNLDPTTVFRLKKMLQELKEEHKTTILISSHDLNHITDVCERIVILDNGLVVQDLEHGPDNLKVLEDYFAV